MDDALNEGPLLELKRGPEESLREVKRARRGIPQDARSEVSHELARTEELVPGDTADKLAHDIRRAMSVTARWMFTVPPRVWLAVSHTHMVAQIYWQTELHVNQCGYVKPSPLVVVERLAHWLRPVLPDVAPEVIHRCLTLTRLQRVIEAYVALLLRAKLLGLHFSNDVATEQRFDRAIHLKMIDIPLHAGGLCIVVFPGITIRAAAFESPRVLSKGFVVPLQPPEELDSLRQELRDSAGFVMRKGHLMSKKSLMNITDQPFDEREALWRDAMDTAEREKGRATSADDAATKESLEAHGDLKNLQRNAGGPEKAALPTTARLDGEKEDSQRKSARGGGDAGGVGSFVKPSGLETLPSEEVEQRWRSCCSRLGLPGISSAEAGALRSLSRI